MNKKNNEKTALTNSKSITHSLLSSQNAFTLAEVLITLAIIGVVAALTIPSLVQNYKERETVTRLKEFYSVFSQAYQLAILEHGTFDQWGLGDTNPKVEQEDGSFQRDEYSLNNYNKFFEIMKKYLKYDSYGNFNNSNVGITSDGHDLEADAKNRGLLLSNGTAIRGINLATSHCATGYCGDFYIVTDDGTMSEEKEDGQAYKRPQAFCFVILNDRIVPKPLTQTKFREYCLNGKNYSYCTEWVIKNGNMDYLHCDDLDINGKNKCD